MADLTVKIKGDGSDAIEAMNEVRTEAQRTANALKGSADQTATANRNQAESFTQVRDAIRQMVQGDLIGGVENLSKSLVALGRGATNNGATAPALQAVTKSVTGLNAAAGETGAAATLAATAMRGLGTAALAAGAVITTALVVAVVAAGVAMVALVRGAREMIETATLVGTRSRDEFNKFQKSIELAGFQVTAMDRALSQGIVRQVEALKVASDGLFLEVIRTSGPQFIQLLREVGRLLQEAQPIVSAFGTFLSTGFAAASAAIATFNNLLAIAKQDLLALAFTLSNSAVLSGLFKANFEAARKEAETIANTLPRATFDGEKAKADVQSQIALLKVYEQQTTRIANEELAAAKRLYEAKGISAEQYAAKQLEIERRVLAAKLATIDAEAELVGKDGETALQAQAKRAQLQEQALRLLSDYKERSKQIRDAQLREESDAINRTLENSRRIAQERLRLAQELQQIAFDIQAIRLDTQSINLQRDQANPGNEATELARAQALAEAQVRLQSERTQAQIQAQRDELEFADLTYQEKLRLEQSFNAQLIAERQRLGNELAAIAVTTRTTELQTQGFDAGQAAAIAEFESTIERQATAAEKLRVAIRATALELQKTLPSGAAVAATAFKQLASAMAQSIGAFVSGQASFKQALAQMTGAIFKNLGDVALAKGAEQFAWALSSLAAGDFAGAAKHFAAGAAWSALGGVVGGVGSAIAGGGGGAQAGGLSQQLTGTNQPTTIEERQRFIDGQGLARAQTGITITLKTDQAQIVQNVEYGLSQSYRNDGTARRVIQAETQGTALDS
jgi:hypothetical protein